MNERSQALYIHIPFCHQLCDYCDFAKLYVNEAVIKRYVEALLIELRLKVKTDDQFTSVYVGGGTPSVLKKQAVHDIFTFLHPHIAPNAEITFEMNPEDVTASYVSMLADCGVNRISLGIQSFSDNLLQRVGRNHTAAKSIEALNILKASSMTNVTVDLMFALPGQTLEDVKNDVHYLTQLDLPHISLYSLILEKRTKLYLQQSEYQFVDEETEAEMYLYIINYLKKQGYTQYEISNFARNTHAESKHNLAYWHQHAYYGVGLGAHQFIDNIRSANTRSINTYIQKLSEKTLPVSETEVLTDQQLLEEFCFLAFRDCVRGLNITTLKQKYPDVYAQCEQEIRMIIATLEQKGLIQQYRADQYRLTTNGRLLANEVFQAFININ